MTFASVAGPGGRVAVIARSVHGLEWVCAWEASSVPGVCGGIVLGRRQVGFDVESVGPELLGLRTADDVFLKLAVIEDVGTAKADLPALGRNAARLDWESALRSLHAVRDLPQHGSFDVVASLEGRHAYNRYAVERCVGMALEPVLGGAFLERDGDREAGVGSDLSVRVFIHGDQAVVAMRLGSRPLHRRAYKIRTGPGTLHPPAAAALAAIGAPAAGMMLDPFCGDGTIAIEAGLAHRGLTIVASDLDPQRVQNARQNAAEAGVDIDVRLADAAPMAERFSDVDAVITNPPWNLAVNAGGRLRGSGADFWDSLARVLRQGGLLCCVTDADLEVPVVLARHGWQVGLEQRIRLAGRVAIVLLAGPPGQEAPQLPAGLARCREEALASGVITRTGF